MKYIRTKDGIYEIDETFKRDNQIAFFDNKERTHGYIVGFFEGKNVLKQADTIEELCDGWIIECLGWDKPIFKRQLRYINWRDYVKTANKYKATHYACIFVKLQNGAIRIEPVAKMNKKGELELL